MTGLAPPRLEKLRRPAHAAAAALAAGHGAPGVYVSNALLDDEDGGGELHGLVDAEGALRAVAWFGIRGNLVALGDASDATEVWAAGLMQVTSPWRIALAPETLIAALAKRDPRPPIVRRTQVHYGCKRGELAEPGSSAARVRLAVRADVDALCEAALDLNESDLHVPRERVHRAWLEKSVRRRMREGRTYVLGPIGRPNCKLDVGSRGRAGAVLEGVFTLPSERRKGLATALVLGVAELLLRDLDLVCLHVDAANAAARAAYERAGMRSAGECGLLLREG